MAIQHIGNTGYIGSGANAITVGVPTGYQQNDLLLLILQGYDAYPAAPAGWTSIDTQTNTNTFLRVCYKFAATTEEAVAVADSGNSTRGIMVCFRGVDTTTPINATSKATSSGTSYSGAGLTTTINNCMVVNCVGFRDADANDTDNYTSWANASLASVTEGWDEGTNAGTGGGIAYAYGIDTTAGTVNAFTATVDLGANYSATITIALKDSAEGKSGSVTISNSNSVSATGKKGGNANGGSITTITDSFDRTNAASLGTTNTGQTWAQSQTWAIESNLARSTSDIEPKAQIEVGTVDYAAEVKLSALGTYGGLSFRAVDTANLFSFVPNSSYSLYKIYKMVSGTGSEYAATTIVPAINDILKVVCSGTNVKFYVNEELVKELTITDYATTGTKAGLTTHLASGQNSRFDNFSVTYGSTTNVVEIEHSNSIAATGVKDAIVNKNGTVEISHTSAINAQGGKKGASGSVSISHDSFNSITGRKDGKATNWGTIVSDSFDRADNASVVGTADTGQTWTQRNGTVGINSNRYRAITDGAVYMDIGVTDCEQSIDVIQTASGCSQSLDIRTDGTTNNRIVVWCKPDKATIEIWRFISGAQWQMGSDIPCTFVAGVPKNLKIRSIGNDFSLYIDRSETPAWTFTNDNVLKTNIITVLGVDLYGTEGLFDNFLVKGNTLKLQMESSNSIAVTGAKVDAINKNGTVEITNSHEVSAAGKAVNKSGSVAISHSSSNYATGKAVDRNGLAAIAHSNAVLTTGAKNVEGCTTPPINLISNPKFGAGHYNGWKRYSSYGVWSVVDGAIHGERNTLAPYIGTDTAWDIPIGHKLYIRFKHRANRVLTGCRFWCSTTLGQNSTVTNNYYNIGTKWGAYSVIGTTASAITNLFALYPISQTAGDWTEYDDIVLIDLTAVYGTGNEPTLEWCDANIKDTIYHTNLVVVTGKAVNKSGSVAISNSNSVLVAGKKYGQSTAVIQHSNSAYAAGRKTAKVNISISNGSSNLVTGRKGAKSATAIQHSTSILIAGAKTSENVNGGVVAIVNYVSIAAAGRKSSRAPPVSIAGTDSISVTGMRIAKGTVSISNSDSVAATGRKTTKAYVGIYCVNSNSAAGRKVVKCSVFINNGQAVLITGRKITAEMGAVSINGESSLIVIGQKVAKKTVSFSNSNAGSASGHKGGNTQVIIIDQNEIAAGATKASFAEILISNQSSIMAVAIRSSTHKPYEVLLELTERRLDIDLGVTEGGVEISIDERIAVLEVEEWHL
ncbi:MAG: hypothetical protein AB9888_08055 [Bacteroidales bacterium]